MQCDMSEYLTLQYTHFTTQIHYILYHTALKMMTKCALCMFANLYVHTTQSADIF